jgi:CPA2 family monovalent cation:H+ antiporter-2
MMLSETEYRHQIEIELRPFKDILLGLFFIVVGMRLDFAVLPELWPWIVLLVLGLIFGKGSLIALLTWSYGKDREVALRTGMVLAHGGEFGFALLALALATGLLGLDEIQPILVAVVITMLLAPILIRYNQALAARLLPRIPAAHSAAGEIAAAVHDTRRHVIICGFGRVGGQIASLLRRENIPCVALDLHPAQVRRAWEDGDKVFYGDASHHDILQAVGLERASALVISFSNDAQALKILHNARALRSDLPILVRSRDDAGLEALLRTGASAVIPETLETSLMLTSHLLKLLQIPDARIADLLQSVRDDRYLLLRDI